MTLVLVHRQQHLPPTRPSTKKTAKSCSSCCPQNDADDARDDDGDDGERDAVDVVADANAVKTMTKLARHHEDGYRCYCNCSWQELMSSDYC